MSTVSVPLPEDLEKFVTETAEAHGSNKAAVIRRAIKRMAEEEAVQAVLRAEQELAAGHGLQGDLDELAKRII